MALVEPYLGGSHQAWAEGYRAASHHDVEIVSHPARFWKWRMQGAHVTLADAFRAAVDRAGPYDVILAGSMLHLPAFLGMVRDLTPVPPVAVYLHESQLTYPLSDRDRPDEAYAMINWTSALVADLVIFNSSYHRRVFFEEAGSFLGRFPDHKHTSKLAAVRDRAEVFPVGVDLRRFDGVAPAAATAPVILWNQRWEYDKGPAAFAEAITALAASGHDFRVIMTGERFVGQPGEFEALPAVLGDRLVHFGFAEDDVYRALVAAADIVVSTAEQEFFGVAITEAMYAGAFPLLPDRLVYPERLPERHHEACLYADGELCGRLELAIGDLSECRKVGAELRRHVAGLDWEHIAPAYDDRLARLVADGARPLPQ